MTNALRDAVEIERDRLADKLRALEATPGSTLMEARILQRDIEMLERKLIWFDSAPKCWFR